MIPKKAQIINSVRRANSAVEPVGVDFDGANDYLSRASDLTGNADGKTFTVSAWVWLAASAGSGRVYHAGSSTRFYTMLDDGRFSILGLNAAGSTILNAYFSSGIKPQYEQTWIHVLISIDLANASNRAIYFNDQDVTSLVTWETYTDDSVEFTTPQHSIGAYTTGAAALKGRLAHVFLDYTYRDLSLEANRRLFITDDLKPASGQAALSPILYLPMDDPTAPGRNDGTGGDFTLNGTIARAGRGPNQYNAAASTFDGTADYLTSSSLTGAVDGKEFTASFNIKLNSYDNDPIFSFGVSGTSQSFYIRPTSSGFINVFATNAAGATILDFTSTEAVVLNRYQNVSISVDLTTLLNRHIQIDGVAIAGTWTTYSDDSIDFTTSLYRVAQNVFTNRYLDGELSDVYFDTTYIDLSANNPFFDTATNKPKFLGVNGELPTGTAPLIYLPLRGDNAGKNMGTGGDFTVNSGPYTGARGPSEFWSESAEFNGTNQYLSRTSALTGAVDGKELSFAVSINPDFVNANDYIFEIGNFVINVYFTGTNKLQFIAYSNGGATKIAQFTGAVTITSGSWQNLLISLDLTNAANRHIYVGGSPDGGSWSTYINDSMGIAESTMKIARGQTDYYDGKIGFLWFNTEYIDFSLEANRLKFFDAFGYPVDVGADGSLPTGNVPLIYMNKDFHLGTNHGTGGNFTPVSAPTDGGFVKG